MATNIDYQYYPICWSGNWEDTISQAEDVISGLREKAMLSDGYISFNRYKTVSSADYQRSSERTDVTTIPYCLIETVNLRVNRTLSIQKANIVITDIPVVSSRSLEEANNDAQSNLVSRASRNGKIKQSS